MYKFGPYGPNHSTAATFAFRKELLKQTRYDDSACVAEEKKFLKDYTIPFVQLDSMKSILVVSHNHNSFDKKELLANPNPFVTLSDKTVEDFIKEDDIRSFFIEDVDKLLEEYEPGDPKNKPDVLKQLAEIKTKRETIAKQKFKEQTDYNNMISKISKINANNANNVNQGLIDGLNMTIHELTTENALLKDKIKYYEDKIKQLIKEKIEEKTAITNANK